MASEKFVREEFGFMCENCGYLNGGCDRSCYKDESMSDLRDRILFRFDGSLGTTLRRIRRDCHMWMRLKHKRWSTGNVAIILYFLEKEANRKEEDAEYYKNEIKDPHYTPEDVAEMTEQLDRLKEDATRIRYALFEIRHKCYRESVFWKEQ